MAEGKFNETLIAFRSGHYKRVTGTWEGDSVWCHFGKARGGHVHINKAEVEYMETFEDAGRPYRANLPSKDDPLGQYNSTARGEGRPDKEAEANKPENLQWREVKDHGREK